MIYDAFFENLTFNSSEFNGLHNEIIFQLDILPESFLTISLKVSDIDSYDHFRVAVSLSEVISS